MKHIMLLGDAKIEALDIKHVEEANCTAEKMKEEMAMRAQQILFQRVNGSEDTFHRLGQQSKQ